MPNLTTATSHRTRATLQQVAQSHASSRALSATTRDVFRHIVEGHAWNLTAAATIDLLNDAFFEAATSCATRAGQSYSRRVMCSDLMALRDAVLAGQSVLPVVSTMTIKVQGDPDLFRTALLNLERDDVKVVYVSNPESE